MCTPIAEDVELLKQMMNADSTVSITYVGSVQSGPVYMDLYLVYSDDAMLHIVAVRRLCPSEKELGEVMKQI